MACRVEPKRARLPEIDLHDHAPHARSCQERPQSFQDPELHSLDVDLDEGRPVTDRLLQPTDPVPVRGDRGQTHLVPAQNVRRAAVPRIVGHAGSFAPVRETDVEGQHRATRLVPVDVPDEIGEGRRIDLEGDHEAAGTHALGAVEREHAHVGADVDEAATCRNPVELGRDHAVPISVEAARPGEIAVSVSQEGAVRGPNVEVPPHPRDDPADGGLAVEAVVAQEPGEEPLHDGHDLGAPSRGGGVALQRGALRRW